MPNTLEIIKPQYIISKKGRKTAVVIDLKDYENLLEFIEDLEDANDLLNAERRATEFIPYNEFRKKWITP